MKSKYAKEHEIQDYDIPDYILRPVNVDLSSSGREVDIFTQTSDLNYSISH